MLSHKMKKRLKKAMKRWKSFKCDQALSKGKMIFSEESSRAIYEMGNMELIELRQTSATIQCPSCLKHVPEGLNMCQCGVWLRPNQSTMDRIRTAFAVLKNLECRASVIPRQQDHQKAMLAKRGWNAANTNLYWTDGRTTKYIKFVDADYLIWQILPCVLEMCRVAEDDDIRAKTRRALPSRTRKQKRRSLDERLGVADFWVRGLLLDKLYSIFHALVIVFSFGFVLCLLVGEGAFTSRPSACVD